MGLKAGAHVSILLNKIAYVCAQFYLSYLLISNLLASCLLTCAPAFRELQPV